MIASSAAIASQVVFATWFIGAPLLVLTSLSARRSEHLPSRAARTEAADQAEDLHPSVDGQRAEGGQRFRAKLDPPRADGAADGIGVGARRDVDQAEGGAELLQQVQVGIPDHRFAVRA